MSWPRTVVVILVSIALQGGCTARPKSPPSPNAGSQLRRFEFVRQKMGGPFQVVLYAVDDAAASRAAEAAYGRVDALNAILSDFDPASEVSRLSQRTAGGATRPIPVSDELWTVLECGQRLAGQTGGAFDVTIGPFVRLWRRARNLRELPTPARIEQTRRSVGYQHIRLDRQNRTVQLLVPRMRLDLGGLAIGYITDQARDAAAAAGVPRVLVDGGGEISVGDPPPGRTGWRVAIQSLKSPENVTGQYVLVRNACVTTSGDTRRFIELGGVRYSHIIDPRTGLGLTRRIGATIISTNGMVADALDTAVCVLGPEKGIALIEDTPGAAGRITTIDAAEVNVYESRRFHEFIAPNADWPTQNAE